MTEEPDDVRTMNSSTAATSNAQPLLRGRAAVQQLIKDYAALETPSNASAPAEDSEDDSEDDEPPPAKHSDQQR